jgi:hypothetical protein
MPRRLIPLLPSQSLKENVTQAAVIPLQKRRNKRRITKTRTDTAVAAPSNKAPQRRLMWMLP